MRPTHWIPAAALAASLLSAMCPSTADAQPFPRLGLYGSLIGDGYPYVRPDGSLDTLELRRASRFGHVIIDAYPVSPYRPDIVQAMRALNPNIELLGYLLTNSIWQVNDADSTRHIPTLIRHMLRDRDGFLYDKNTGLEYLDHGINMAKKDVNGRFVVAEGLADIVRDHIIASGDWDGLFADVFCRGIAWTQGGTSSVIDYQRAGYPTLAALDAAWIAASDTLAARLRRDGGPDFKLVGNCAGSAHHGLFNGWMRENFPFQQGGTWASNMLGDASTRGYFKDDADYLPPASNWIATASSGSSGTEYNDFNTHRLRYGLGSAALGNGVHSFLPERSVRVAPYQDWWYDEYAVDLATGRSSEALQHTGWLGQPLGPHHTMLWVGSAPDAITNAGFEVNTTTGWTFATFAPAAATLTRDGTTAAVGTSSAKVHITAASTVDWNVYLSSVGQLAVQAGTSCSATFWCKSDAPRVVRVLAGNSGGSANITVDATWRQYQVVLQPSTSMNASLAFFVGLQDGDVWFDDVHFQSGATSVWRRDFQNGIVLVNPTELSLDVPLEFPFRRILGTRPASVNNGLVSATQHVPPFDALFLLRTEIDTTPPAGVRDLRPGP
ncbi:MAG: putative glycoside hydrolase [Candidatus Eisenbacteria bacterium]